MWLKKNNTLINLEHFDGLEIDKNDSSLVVLVQATPNYIKRNGLARYDDAETVVCVIEEITAAMQRGDNLYVMP